jgi:hypothetical protein
MQLRADLSNYHDKYRKTVRENHVDTVNLAPTLNRADIIQHQTIGAYRNGDRWTYLRDAEHLTSSWIDFGDCRSDQ